MTSACFSVLDLLHHVTGSEGAAKDANLFKLYKWQCVPRRDKMQALKGCELMTKGRMMMCAAQKKQKTKQPFI